MAIDILARDSADLARRSTRFRFRGLPLVGFLGDSLSQFGINVATGNVQWTNSSYIPWLRRLLRDRGQTSTALNFGVASQRTDHFLNVQVPQAIAAGIDIAFVQIGTNDVANFTLAQSIANVTAGVSLLNAAGIAVVLIAVAPQTAWSAASRQQAAAYNRFLRSLSVDRARNVRFVDVNPTYVDYATGNALAGYQFNDNVHDSPAGGYVKAQTILAATDDLFPRLAELLPISAAADYDAALSPNGNILANSLFTGTGGQKRNGATGTVADNWALMLANAGGSTITAAGSKGNDTTYPTLPTQIVTIGGTNDGNSVRLRTQSVVGTDGITVPAGIAIGDSVVMEANIRWSGVAGLREVRAALYANNSAVRAFDGSNFKPNTASADMPLPVAVGDLFYRTPPLVYPGGGLDAMIEMYGVAGAALAGTITISRVAVRKV